MQLKILLAGTVYQHLLRLQVAQHLLHIVVGALARQELTRRDIEEADTAG